MFGRSAALAQSGHWAAGLLLLSVVAGPAPVLAQSTPSPQQPAVQSATPDAEPSDPFQSAAPPDTGDSAPPVAAHVPQPPAPLQPAPSPSIAPVAHAAPLTPESKCCRAGIREMPAEQAATPAQTVQPQTIQPQTAQTAEPVQPAQSPEYAPPAEVAEPVPPAIPAPTAPAPTFPPAAAAPAASPTPPVTVAAPGEPPANSPDAAPPATEPPAPPPPVAVDHPKLVDTATVEAPGQTLLLFGIVGLPGTFTDGLKGYIAAAGDRLTCEPHASAGYVCVLPDGTDVAMVALINGAAQTAADAPEIYAKEQTEAQSARRGVWASLPPPPVSIKHPGAQDTATLLADGQIYALDGVEGVGGDYARNLQGYIAANGDSMLCQPQGDAGHYVCLLSDGTDVAKVALVNGAARVASDAPDEYRAQQADAIAHRRGIWQNVSTADAELALAEPPPAQVVVPEEPVDGLVYVGGVPTAMVDGSTVFFAYVDGAGWGYWDHDHHWRGAPDRYGRHLDHFHPAGAGLHGHGPRSGFAEAGHAGPGAPEHPGVAHAGALNAGAGHPAIGNAGAGHPGVAHVGGPAQVASARPGMPSQPRVTSRPAAAPFVHPSGPAAGAFAHPTNVPHAAPAVRSAPVKCKGKC